jgi:hypothetical protein
MVKSGASTDGLSAGMPEKSTEMPGFERSVQENCGMIGMIAGDPLASCSKDRKTLPHHGKRLMIQEEIRFLQTDPGSLKTVFIPVNGGCLIMCNLRRSELFLCSSVF